MSISWNRLNKIIFYIVACDLLFFPYISSLKSSVSLIILFIVFPLKYFTGRYSFGRNDLLVFLSFVAIFLSLFKGYLYYRGFVYLGSQGVDYFSVTLVNSALLLFCFLYWLFYVKFFRFNYANIDWIIVCFILFNFFLSVTYFYDPLGFFSLRNFWTMGNGNVSYAEFNESVRFTGIFSDPNNLSVCLVSALAFVVFNSQIVSSRLKLVLIALTSVSVFATMSSTGVFSLIFVLCCYLVSVFFVGRYSVLSLLVFFVGSILSVFLLREIVEVLLSSDFGSVSFARVANNSGSLSHRFDIYNKILKESEFISNFVIGNGSVFIDSTYVRPHSGHLYLMYSYGLPFYILFMIVFFSISLNRSIIKQLYIVPFFLGFTLNVGVYDLRYIGLLVLLVSTFKYNKVYFR